MAQATATNSYEHNGKKYRLADHRDIGKDVWVSDEGFQDAVVESLYTAELQEYHPKNTKRKYKTGCMWTYAFVEIEEPVPAVVPFNGTLEVGQWYETNNGQRLHCNSRTHHDTYPMVMVQEDGTVETYMEKGLWIEDYDMDDECSIALQLVGCTGFDWTKPVPPAVVPEPEPVDTRPEPPAGWRYVAEDEVITEGDKYLQEDRELYQLTGAVSGIGKTPKQLQEANSYSWHEDWVGVIRKLPKQEPKVFSQSVTTEILDDLCKTIHAKQKATGWWDAADNPLIVPVKLMLAVTELAEACEGDRKNIPDTHLPHRSMLSVELADAVIRIADLAGFLKIPLGTVIAEKEAYNASRADHKPEVRKAANGKRY